MSIVTKTGDQGETQLLGGKRVSKTNLRIEWVGTLDESSAQLGVAQGLLREIMFDKIPLQKIQEDLFELGAGQSMETPLARIEKELQALEVTLPILKNFILPGGHPGAAHLHLARAVCRRAERHLCQLKEAGEPLPPAALPYLNRLSDYLFLLARKVNQVTQTPEVIWKGGSPML